MAEFKKQYKVLFNESLNKLESLVYFEINHERWVPVGGAFFVMTDTARGRSGWYQTLWLPEPRWKDEPEILVEDKDVGVGPTC